MTDQTPGLTCEADTSGRHATSARACGAPATMAFRTQAHDRSERLEARCARHAGILKRKRWPGGDLVELTPEIVEAIATRVAETRARHDVERAARRAAAEERTEAARLEAIGADAVAWTVAFAPEEALDGWDGAAPSYRTVPRWEVLPEGAERAWDSAEVKVERKDDWPPAIALRAPSRLTRKQALVLADALRAAVEAA